ncbi:MAG: ATP-dependent protease LonB [Desulfitobacteriaceae bacterium]|nr:ATP-dependent protease LonB [Desulfitobacteriaceae bacterium]
MTDNFGLNSIITFIQVFFAVVIGLYFWNLLKGQQGNKVAVERESKKELEKLKKMRTVSLTEPLAEKTRPAHFAEVIGQGEGLKALRAALCGPNPQHTIIYGPPGIGKTAAARLVLDEAKKSSDSPFKEDAKFVEIDGATARFDERGIADPLIGSVHDPIYQGAGAMGMAGIPQPKPGAVTKAHGGLLFIDEIGELHSIQINKLLKVLEDRKVMLESAYYNSEDTNIPSHIHDIFQNGLPADFRLVAATTRQPEEIPPAIRSRCVEIYFSPLNSQEIALISQNAAKKLNFELDEQAIKVLKGYATNGREAVNMVQIAAGLAITEGRNNLSAGDLEWVANCGHYAPRPNKKIASHPQVGVVNGMAVTGPNMGTLLELEVVVIPVRKGKGQIVVTGVVEEEELGSRNGGRIRRKSMVKGSVENVLTILKQHLQVDPKDYDIHVNFPGGIPIDGPSAGVTIATAIYSAITGSLVDNQVAMTGEVSIRGYIKPVGGITAKVEAARQAGVKKVIIPKENWQEVFDKLTDCKVIAVERLEEIFKLALLPAKPQGKTLVGQYSHGLQEISF